MTIKHDHVTATYLEKYIKNHEAVVSEYAFNPSALCEHYQRIKLMRELLEEMKASLQAEFNDNFNNW